MEPFSSIIFESFLGKVFMGLSDIDTTKGETDEVAPGPAGPTFSAVGHRDVIKMEYEIGIGTIDAWKADKIIAHTESFKNGVSLSEIKWGFYNPSESGTKESAFLDFTLHDIAGEAISDYLRIKSGSTIIFFKGPMSDGKIWSGKEAIYKPIAQDCKLQFSPTQGFTYSFSAMPIGHLPKTKELATPAQITINGLDEAGNPHANTFEYYLKELAEKWNAHLAGDNIKVAKAMIKFEISTGYGIQDDLKNHVPYITERSGEENELKKSGDPTTPIQQYEIPPNTDLATAVKGLWQQRFAEKDEDPDASINAGSQLEVNFREYKKGTNYIDVRLHRKTKTDTVTNIIPVCIGDDENCKNAAYRAQLVEINFGEKFLQVASVNKMNSIDANSHGEAHQAGNSAHTVKSASDEYKISGETMMKETTAGMSHVPNLPAGNNPTMDGWGNFQTTLNNYKSPEFTLEIELPYSFGFTPIVNGGKLADAIEGCQSCGILFTEGVDLEFYWYTDPTCESLKKVKEISTRYRITKVTHTIGLSGNVTQVSLSHLNASI